MDLKSFVKQFVNNRIDAELYEELSKSAIVQHIYIIRHWNIDIFTSDIYVWSVNHKQR